jgi:hypothetical protein
MNLRTLNNSAYLRTAIKALEQDIENRYHPIRSPNGREIIGSPGNRTSNPTEKNALENIELNEELDARRRELQRVLNEIERWLKTVDDVEVEAIVRWRFKLGLTWKAASLKVYGYPNPDRARKKVERFLKKSEESVSSASSM